MADDETTDKKEATERRVYNLPASLLERLRAYQTNEGITSEVEAARRLLDSALQMKDTVKDILNTLAKKFSEEHDLRVLASEVLTRHILVDSVRFTDTDVRFTLSNGEMGLISKNGHLFLSHTEVGEDNWNAYKIISGRRQTITAPNLGVSKGGDLDDEIPF